MQWLMVYPRRVCCRKLLQNNLATRPNKQATREERERLHFGEDANRTREGNGAENLPILRRLVLGILKQVKGNKTMENAKYQCAVDTECRTKIIERFLMR